MAGNPYRSSEPGLGPLMRDIKNKICTSVPSEVKMVVEAITRDRTINRQLTTVPPAFRTSQIVGKHSPSSAVIANSIRLEFLDNLVSIELYVKVDTKEAAKRK